MAMTISEAYLEVVDFLSEPKNLDQAFDLREAFPAVLDKFHIRFWENLKSVLEAELTKMGITNWVVSFFNDSGSSEDFAKPGKKGTSDEAYPALAISPIADMPLFCSFLVEQRFIITEPLADLHYGYGFNDGLSKSRLIKLFNEAKVTIEDPQKKEWIRYRGQLEDGWLACKDLPYKLRARRETVMLAEGDSLQRSVADAVLDLFKEKREDVEKINAALQRQQMKSKKSEL